MGSGLCIYMHEVYDFAFLYFPIDIVFDGDLHYCICKCSLYTKLLTHVFLLQWVLYLSSSQVQYFLVFNSASTVLVILTLYFNNSCTVQYAIYITLNVWPFDAVLYCIIMYCTYSMWHSKWVLTMTHYFSVQ